MPGYLEYILYRYINSDIFLWTTFNSWLDFCYFCSRATFISSSFFRKLYSSEIRGLCLMKLSSEMLQNLPSFWNKNIQIVFSALHFEQLWIFNTVKNPNLLEMKKKIWQILKHFTRQFHQALTSYFWRVINASLNSRGLKTKEWDILKSRWD